MKILLVHNRYQQPGGEDGVFAQERVLLEGRGHYVSVITENNSSISGFRSKLATGIQATYSRAARTKVDSEIARFKPDIVHIHNFFPQFSPSIYGACKEAQVPVIQTLHNYRLICPNALLFRENKPCEECIGKLIAWPGIGHACYRESHLGTAAVAVMQTTHKLLNTWSRCVDAYIALSEFAKGKFIAGGLPADRVFVKPNCLTIDPGPRTKSSGFALYVGRLSVEKGIQTLLTAWRSLRNRQLKIVGDGPLRAKVEENRSFNVEFLGPKSSEDVLDLIGEAAFLIIPSECYENFPRVIVEAFSRGVPVLASNLGSISEIVRHNYTGVLFPPGDPDHLANQAEWLFSRSADLQRMSGAARKEFLARYSADKNYELLMRVYAQAAER